MRTKKVCAIDDRLLAAYKAAGVTPSEALHQAIQNAAGVYGFDIKKLSAKPKAKKFEVGCMAEQKPTRGKTKGKRCVKCSRRTR